MSSYQERQDEEYQALESIFAEDVEDLRKKVAWNIARPLELKLSLKPQHSMGAEGQVYTQLDMVVKCPPKYPDVLPDISLLNPKGISNQLVNELKAELEEEAKQNLGEVMIFQLANCVQAFLHKHNRPPAQSFYEQMINNEKQQQERTKLIEEQKRQEMELEVQRRKEALRNETRRRRGDQKQIEASTPLFAPGMVSKPIPISPSPSPINPTTPHKAGRSVSPVTPVGSKPSTVSRRQRRTSTPMKSEEEDLSCSPCKDHSVGVTVLTFSINKSERSIQRGKCLGHSETGRTTYAGMDTTTGDLVAVAEWVLKWKHQPKRSNSQNKGEDAEGAAHLKQVLNIEQELFTLLRLHHPNLIHYLALRYQNDFGKITVHLLMEYSGGTNLSIYSRRKDPLPLDVLRGYISELLEALQYLHKNAVVHKNLRASSVFVDSMGKVRLGDYSLDKRLGDLYQTVDKARPGVHFSDQRPMIIGRGGQKGDIYQLGLLLLTLIEAEPLQESIPEVPTNLPSVVQDFLHKCLITDEKLRWSSAQLREHSFVKDPLPDAKSLHYSIPNKEDDSDHEDASESKEEENLEYLTSLVASGQSRLASEFELLKVLGKGGFGDVLKVKNKLDGRFYAIKRIPLNPRSKLFNKKMKREVKLLSRLNHENVVRYYSSWIEISDESIHSENSSNYSSSQPTLAAAISKKAPHIVRSIPLTKTPVLKVGVKSANSSFDPIGDVENLIPIVGDESVDWLTSFDKGGETLFDDSSSDEEDEADVFGSSFMPKMDRSDDSIVFDSDDTETNDDTESNDKVKLQFPQNDSDFSTPGNQEAETEPEQFGVKILYIQMEYCEKSTLRNCIDAGLCQDMDRVWRLFREIIEGLVHIHGQGMIHRDLKPVNIFLDSQDHVKIGDFGLATTDILVKEGALLDVTLPSPHDVGLNSSQSGSGDGNLTGKVGTALYVSPEVMAGGNKTHYDQKVDIYSLGIIFFEMCYKCLTGMERVKVLNNLRSPAIALPEDFDVRQRKNQSELIKWLLNHDPTLRPTSKELLSSDYLPPPQVQETELSEMLRSTVANPQSSSYRHMLNAIFNQTVTPLHDLTYDHEIYETIPSCQTALLHQEVEAVLTEVFVRHGAVSIPLPLFMPKASVYEGDEQLVRVMDHRGGILSLPMDLRVPFARYIGRGNIHSLKRYAIEKVYREKKFYNVLYKVHPTELTECAFDIVTPSASLIPDAEVLTVIQEVIDKFPTLQARNYYVRINHMSVLRAVLLHCGILETTHQKVLKLLADNTMSKTSRVTALEAELNVKVTEQLISLLDTEGPLNKVSSILRCITKTVGQASSLAKSGLHDLDCILSHATSMGLKLQVLVSLGLVYNPHQYSGAVFQVMCDSRKRKKVVTEVLAAGGRYDKLIDKYTSPLHTSSTHIHAVGISLSFERLVATVSKGEQNLSQYDVTVCSLGHQIMLKERLAIARDLWAAGLKTEVLYDKTEDFDELQENCQSRGVSHIIILKDGEMSSVKVRSIEKDHMTEESVPLHHLVEYLQKKATTKGTQSDPHSNSNQRHLTKETSGFSESTKNVITNGSGTASNFNFNIIFVHDKAGGKNAVSHQFTTKRRHEALIAGKVSAHFSWLPERNLEVLALEVPTSCIKTIQAYLELGEETAFESSISAIMEKQGKLRKYLVSVFDNIHDLKFKKKCNFILLYSMKEETLKLLT